MSKLKVLPEERVLLQVQSPIVKTAEPIITPRHITENGVYYAKQEGAAGFDPVTVQVDMTPAIEQALADLPAGYLKADPAWNSWYMLCANRPSMVQSLKYEDCANATHFVSAFQSCNVKSIPRLDLRKATTIQNMFIYSSSIVEIGEMEIPKVTFADNAFSGCSGLERISFAKECIHVSLSFSNSSKLNDASIRSIIDGLADLTGKATQTLTFHKDVGARLSEAQKAVLTAKNWTLVY